MPRIATGLAMVCRTNRKILKSPHCAAHWGASSHARAPLAAQVPLCQRRANLRGNTTGHEHPVGQQHRGTASLCRKHLTNRINATVRRCQRASRYAGGIFHRLPVTQSTAQPDL